MSETRLREVTVGDVLEPNDIIDTEAVVVAVDEHAHQTLLTVIDTVGEEHQIAEDSDSVVEVLYHVQPLDDADRDLLDTLTAELDALGGRGVALAETIDRLRLRSRLTPPTGGILLNSGHVHTPLTISVADGDARLSLQVSDEGIMLDAFDADGNCLGTMAGDFEQWQQRVVTDDSGVKFDAVVKYLGKELPDLTPRQGIALDILSALGIEHTPPHRRPVQPGDRFRLSKDFRGGGGFPGANWVVPSGTTFTYHDTVDHFDWFQAIVSFDVDVMTSGGTVIKAGSHLRAGWGITNDACSEPLDEDVEG